MQKEADALHELLRLMRLEPLEVNLFRGESRDIGTSRVFGGQVLAQAVLAACQTVEDRLIHSLHAYFLRAGDPEARIVYNVDRSRDGRSFSARRVEAIQHGRPIFTLSASFQAEEEGLDHQFEPVGVPGPETLARVVEIPAPEFENIPQKLQRWFDRFGPFEFRPVRAYDPHEPLVSPPFREFWFRVNGQLDEDPLLHSGPVGICFGFLPDRHGHLAARNLDVAG